MVIGALVAVPFGLTDFSPVADQAWFGVSTPVPFGFSNILVIAVAVGVGLLPTVSPDLYAEFPVWFQIIFDSGISAGAMTAIVLNLLLNSDAANKRVKDDGDHSSYDAVRSAAADTEAR